MTAAVLVFYFLGQPLGSAPFMIDDHFESFGACEEYRQVAGWLLVRSTLGLNNSRDPVPGILMECQRRA